MDKLVGSVAGDLFALLISNMILQIWLTFFDFASPIGGTFLNWSYLDIFTRIWEPDQIRGSILAHIISQNLKNIQIYSNHKLIFFTFAQYTLSYHNIGLTECIKCHAQFQFEKGDPDYSEKDENKVKISKAAAECKANYRCKCYKKACETEFCIMCKASPYHNFKVRYCL
jgi:hypothetical protein